MYEDEDDNGKLGLERVNYPSSKVYPELNSAWYTILFYGASMVAKLTTLLKRDSALTLPMPNINYAGNSIVARIEVWETYGKG